MRIQAETWIIFSTTSANIRTAWWPTYTYKCDPYGIGQEVGSPGVLTSTIAFGKHMDLGENFIFTYCLYKKRVIQS